MVTVKRKLNVSIASRGRIAIRPHDPQRGTIATKAHQIAHPRIAKLMALAIRFDEMLRTGEASDTIELARSGSRYPTTHEPDHGAQPARTGHSRSPAQSPIDKGQTRDSREAASPDRGHACLGNSELRGSKSAMRFGFQNHVMEDLSIKSKKSFLPVFPAESEQSSKFPFSHDQRCQRGSVFILPLNYLKRANLETLGL